MTEAVTNSVMHIEDGKDLVEEVLAVVNNVMFISSLKYLFFHEINRFIMNFRQERN